MPLISAATKYSIVRSSASEKFTLKPTNELCKGFCKVLQEVRYNKFSKWYFELVEMQMPTKYPIAPA